MRKNVIFAAMSGFVGAICLGMIASIIKLATLGNNDFTGPVRVFFIPVAEINNSANEFSVSSGFGLIALGVLFALVAGFVAYQRSSKVTQ
jgi:hypothetical protein